MCMRDVYSFLTITLFVYKELMFKFSDFFLETNSMFYPSFMDVDARGVFA